MKKIKTLKQHSDDLHNKSFSHHTANHKLILKRTGNHPGKHDYDIYSPDGKFIGSIISDHPSGIIQSLKGKGYEIDKK